MWENVPLSLSVWATHIIDDAVINWVANPIEDEFSFKGRGGEEELPGWHHEGSWLYLKSLSLPFPYFLILGLAWVSVSS